MIKDDPKHLAAVVVGVMQHTSSLPGAPPSLIQKQTILCFFDLFLNILQHAGILRWPSKDLKLLWSMEGEVKFGRFCCLLTVQSFDNAWRLWMKC